MWYPQAIARPIPPGSNDPVIVPVGLVYHVRDGEGDSLHDYFDGRSGGVESHWYIRYDGTVEQYRDTYREADANLRGNSWPVGKGRNGLHSVETEGLEHGEWTDAQIEALKELTVWDAREHGWPIRLCPDWNGPGVGYHVMFGAPGPWTSVAKTCPGPDRVRQFEEIFVPWLNAGGEEDWLTMASEAEVRDAVLDALKEGAGYASPYIREQNPGKRPSIRWLVEWAWRLAHGARRNAAQAEAVAKRVEAKADAILEAVAKIDGVDGDALAAKVAAAVERLDAEAVADQLEITVADDDGA